VEALITLFSKYFEAHPVWVVAVILLGAFIIPFLNTMGTKSAESLWSDKPDKKNKRTKKVRLSKKVKYS
jgi:hypothetical protein